MRSGQGWLVRRLSRTRPALRLAALAAATGLLVGCSTDLPFDDDGSASARAREIVDQVREAVEQAKERSAERSGDLDGSTPADGQVLRTDTQTAFDYEEYSSTLQSVFGLLEEYWGQVLPQEFGVAFSPPSRYVYYRPDEGPGPSCGNQSAPANNAFYCPAGDFIAWDESGLIIPYYVGAGDFAAAFVLAHEFGHAMQRRLPDQEQLGILRELQADCFAGAWARSVQDQGYLDKGDLDEATLAVFSARDVPGTEFTDPAAHGTGFERTRAFADGYEDGPAGCYPAPRQRWLVGS